MKLFTITEFSLGQLGIARSLQTDDSVTMDDIVAGIATLARRDASTAVAYKPSPRGSKNPTDYPDTHSGTLDFADLAAVFGRALPQEMVDGYVQQGHYTDRYLVQILADQQ